MPLASRKSRLDVVFEGCSAFFGNRLIGACMVAILCALVSSRAIVSLGAGGYIVECGRILGKRGSKEGHECQSGEHECDKGDAHHGMKRDFIEIFSQSPS